MSSQGSTDCCESNQGKKGFIDEGEIFALINNTQAPNREELIALLARAEEKKGISLADAARLLALDDPELEDLLFAAAKRVKDASFGNRVVLFAPLYISNECVNKCVYCGFSATNHELARKTLSIEEIAQQTRILEDIGQKRLLLVYGEHPKISSTFIADSVREVYRTLEGRGAIRRVNINCAPLSVEGFREIHDAGIGTYQCFQETYHRETYEKVHLAGKKMDYLWRLYAMHRAQEGGIDDVGIGALFGLYDHRFELLAMLKHAQVLEEEFGTGPHTISFPRIEPAHGSPFSTHLPYAVDDHAFKKMVAITRLAAPYTGIIMSTRESAQMRRELLHFGVSQISAASSTAPGGYTENAEQEDTSQFTLGDHRSLDEVVYSLVEDGFLPSWCTACYRSGRTGELFMSLAKDGFIRKFCKPNAVMTFMEYLEDYASERTKAVGLKLIEKELADCSEKDRARLLEQLEKIKDGNRDLYL